ncbi:MAG TPA: YihY/virulence factor BrkB family protein [Dehalococcoidia bacterium]|nr:YihY/virulence factor BrkB family protein [Dehalococcoidia bacterium]
MLLRRSGTLLLRAAKAYSTDKCSQLAAALSYYVLFSLFPLLIFSVALVGIVVDDSQLQTELVDEVMDNIPFSQDEGRNDVTDALSSVAHQSGAIGLIGLIGLAWSGSAVFGVLRSAMNQIFDVETPRPPVIQKLVDIGIVLSLTPFFIASIAATSALRLARRTSEDSPIIGDIPHALGAGWWVASVLLPILVSCVAFLLVYWIVPARRSRLIHLLPGAALAAVLFEVVKVGFNVYLENFGNYDLVFGSLGAVAAFLFWVYLSANILLIGAEVAAEVPAVAAGVYDTPGPARGPRRSLKQKVVRELRKLVMRPEPDPPVGDGP